MEYEIKIEWDCDIATINLTDYDHEEGVEWEDLTEEEKHEITDNLIEQARYNFKITINKKDQEWTTN
jgi:hypothetical protein